MIRGTMDNVLLKVVHTLLIMLKVGMIIVESNKAIYIKGYNNAHLL